MTIMRKNFLLASLLLVSGAASANDTLVVTGEKAKGGDAIALDYASSGSATGFQFKIAIPGGDKAKVNLSGCLKGLPATHAGVCQMTKGIVIGMAYSDSNALLPAGMLSLGTIGVSGASGQAPSVIEFLAADQAGNKIATNLEMGSAAVEKNLAQ